MQFFIDECISPQVAARLNESGEHSAVHPRDIGRRGDPDHVVLRNAIADAIGEPISELPMTPPRVLAAAKGAYRGFRLEYLGGPWRDYAIGDIEA